MPFDNAPQRELTAGERAELDVLTRARALIADPRDWRHGAPPTPIDAPYCAMTACYSASGGVSYDYYGNLSGSIYPRAVYRLARCVVDQSGPVPIGTFNDHPDTTHADVLALYDRAIASLLVP